MMFMIYMIYGDAEERMNGWVRFWRGGRVKV